jgi:ABC-2 family transporter protein
MGDLRAPLRGFSLYSIGLMIDGQHWDRELGMVVNALQVAVGLLMLSVSAATSLAEERQRGSLEVLMATPLPTRSIVWGKWWGTFRSVPRLLILPSLLTAPCHPDDFQTVTTPPRGLALLHDLSPIVYHSGGK